MDFLESLRIALRTLGANRVRSALTMLGVIVGVAAVILLVSIGTGVKTVVTGQLEGLGSNLIFVIPADASSEFSGGPGGSSPFAVRKPLTNEDADMLTDRLGSSAIVVPVLTASVSMKAGNNSTRANMAAGNALGTQVFNATIQSGRHYTNTEWINAARVVALGSEVRDALFPGQDPVGRKVDIEGQRFTVVGHYRPKGRFVRRHRGQPDLHPEHHGAAASRHQEDHADRHQGRRPDRGRVGQGADTAGAATQVR